MGASITTVIGRRGYGKSYWTKRMLASVRAPVMVYDPKHEYPFHPVHSVAEFEALREWTRLSLRVDGDAMAAIMEIERGYSPHVLVVEESHLFLSPQGIDPSLDWLVRMGRGPGISLVFVTQRAKDLHQIVYTMTDHLIVFRQQGAHDLAAIEQATDADVSVLKSLGVGEHVYFRL